jgi:hypothetical protein
LSQRVVYTFIAFVLLQVFSLENGVQGRGTTVVAAQQACSFQ